MTPHHQELRVGQLLGCGVVDCDGRPLGAIEEIRASKIDGRCSVREYVTGVRGAFERLSARRVPSFLLRIAGARRASEGVSIPAHLMDLSDADHPRTRCPKSDLLGRP
jgi:hypothetical protein